MNAKHMLAVKRRSGFTLIELLVVIAIIGILAGLLLAGVMVFWKKGPDTANRNDIQQLAVALDKFKTEWRMSEYPRNTIKLCSNYSSYNPAIPFDAASIAFIAKMWPNLGNFTGINWANRTGATAPVFGNAANPTIDILDGDQCLVFFLGGPPMSAGNAGAGLWGGFATNPQNPMDPTTNKKKSKDFEAGRLMIRPTSTITIGGVNYTTTIAFPSYMDSYNTTALQVPFMYFSSTNRASRANGYDVTANSIGIVPFFLSAGTFHKPDSFQIISAGRDGNFGPGGAWAEATASTYAAAGRDDMTNFYTNTMGN